ncbi:MAG: hypothetical protein CMJ83_20290 [Planctomycetes bacterium]|nr:hypothetical protein [Planctomycetota bacterium]
MANVDSAEIDLKAKTATVTMQKGSLGREVVTKAFEGKKYKVSSFEQVHGIYVLGVSGMR